jgi:hypothetical protein
MPNQPFLDLKGSLMLSGAGMVIFLIGWLLQQAGLQPKPRLARSARAGYNPPYSDRPVPASWSAP